MAAEDGVAYVYENVGLDVTQSTNGVAYVYENVGDDQGQRWTVGVIESIIRHSRYGVAYVYENVT